MSDKSQIINRVMESLDGLQGLNDHLLSIFLKRLKLIEDEFEVAGIDRGHIVFFVPKQDLKQWYSDDTTQDSQLADKKRTIANDIKEQFKLLLYEPSNREEDLKIADMTSRRYFEFYTQKESPVACVHPSYLKIVVNDGSIRFDVGQLFSEIKNFYLQ